MTRGGKREGRKKCEEKGEPSQRKAGNGDPWGGESRRGGDRHCFGKCTVDLGTPNSFLVSFLVGASFLSWLFLLSVVRDLSVS